MRWVDLSPRSGDSFLYAGDTTVRLHPYDRPIEAAGNAHNAGVFAQVALLCNGLASCPMGYVMKLLASLVGDPAAGPLDYNPIEGDWGGDFVEEDQALQYLQFYARGVRLKEIAQGRPPTTAGGGHYLYGGHRPPRRPPRRLHRLSPPPSSSLPSSSPPPPSPVPLPSNSLLHHITHQQHVPHVTPPLPHITPDAPARRPDPRPRPY
ncbi:hypothetical protein C8F04DRAFT_1264030 [Mycena alexandri]|uniref:Uncharacterized protein n=1 Tax=Mycena alexandri TaxID=1745969 RepID=A0AAD6SM60_9AGAR|nr:hypothetical protein C8F04DRAFT_1264030 [Mycena alexandri]